MSQGTDRGQTEGGTEYRLVTGDEFAPLTELQANAYPVTNAMDEPGRTGFTERLRNTSTRDPGQQWWGAWRDGRMVGAFRLHDFTMNFRGNRVPVLGLGGVAVGLEHKKEKVCRDLVRFTVAEAHRRAAPLVALWPFRPDFYRQMGWGLAGRSWRYCFNPQAIPGDWSKAGVRLAGPEDAALLWECRERYLAATHGMLGMRIEALDALLKGHHPKAVIYQDGPHVRGFMLMKYGAIDPGSFIRYDLEVSHPVAESAAARRALLAFLRDQGDQFRRIILDIQDEGLLHALRDPRSAPDCLFPPVWHPAGTQAVGIMQRVVDLPGLLAKAGEGSFDPLLNCVIDLELHDDFLPEHPAQSRWRFAGGRPTREEKAHPDALVTMDVGTLSTLLMGAARLTDLVEYGLAEVAPESMLPAMDRLFALAKGPVCTTGF